MLCIILYETSDKSSVPYSIQENRGNNNAFSRIFYGVSDTEKESVKSVKILCIFRASVINSTKRKGKVGEKNG